MACSSARARRRSPPPRARFICDRTAPRQTTAPTSTPTVTPPGRRLRRRRDFSTLGDTMRIIELSDDAVFNERDQLRTLIKSAPANGYSIEEVRGALRLVDRLDAGGALVLEDADWSFLVALLKNAKWVAALPGIVVMYDKIANAVELAQA